MNKNSHCTYHIYNIFKLKLILTCDSCPSVATQPKTHFYLPLPFTFNAPTPVSSKNMSTNAPQNESLTLSMNQQRPPLHHMTQGSVSLTQDQIFTNIEWDNSEAGYEDFDETKKIGKGDDSSQIWVQEPSIDAGDPFGIMEKGAKMNQKEVLKIGYTKQQAKMCYDLDAEQNNDCKQSDNDKFSEVELFDLDHMKEHMFPELSKKWAEEQKPIINVDDDETDYYTHSQASKKYEVPPLNVDLIKREIEREKKLDLMRMKKEKQDLKELLQVEPRRKLTQKWNKRHKIVSKRTLELLSKKFDEYYAYEQNPDYRGPKMTLREIGQIFDIGPNTIHKLYTEWMDDSTFYERIVHYDLNRRIPERKLTLQRLEHIARLIKQNPFLTQGQITAELNKIDDLKSYKDGQRQQICKSVVARLLKVGKFRKKRVRCIPKQKNTTKSLQIRYEYCVKYKQLVDKKAKIYFLDESGFNLYMTREKAWARPNQEITVNCPISKGKRFSLIAIIGQDGVANWRIIEGTYRKYEYLDFLLEIFKKIYELNQDTHREKWLIMDNCAIHDKEQTFRMSKEWGVNVMFLPAYSPQLNPIQMWFHEVKTKIRKINYSGQRQLMEIMERTLKEYEENDFSNYYHGTLKYVEKGLRKEKY